MDDPWQELLARVPGFGRCGRCPYRESAPFSLCFTCARRSIDALAPWDQRCKVCDLAFNSGEDECRNPMCTWPDRQFEWNYALALHTGRLRNAIGDFKYQDERRWALIFGRILAGALETDPDNFRDFDLIVPSPTYVGQDGRAFDHTRLVVEVAANEVPKHSTWPFDKFNDPTIRKTTATRSLAKRTWQERHEIALEIGQALHVIHPERVRGRRVLVYDDVFTDGTTLNEVARALRQQGGAAGVCGVSLCRQPFTKRPAAQA